MLNGDAFTRTSALKVLRRTICNNQKNTLQKSFGILAHDYANATQHNIKSITLKLLLMSFHIEITVQYFNSMRLQVPTTWPQTSGSPLFSALNKLAQVTTYSPDKHLIFSLAQAVPQRDVFEVDHPRLLTCFFRCHSVLRISRAKDTSGFCPLIYIYHATNLNSRQQIQYNKSTATVSHDCSM